MRLGKRTAKLVREAAVAGFVNGSWYAAGLSRAEVDADYPDDSVVVAGVLRTARAHSDIYRALAKVESVDEASDAVLARQEAARFAFLRELINGRGVGEKGTDQ